MGRFPRHPDIISTCTDIVSPIEEKPPAKRVAFLFSAIPKIVVDTTFPQCYITIVETNITQTRKITMNARYLESELESARTESANARDTFHAIKGWNRKKEMAAEMVEFWSNRVAFLDSRSRRPKTGF